MCDFDICTPVEICDIDGKKIGMSSIDISFPELKALDYIFLDSSDVGVILPKDKNIGEEVVSLVTLFKVEKTYPFIKIFLNCSILPNSAGK